MKLVATGASYDVDLAAAAVSRFCRIETPQDSEFTDGIDTGIGLDGDVGATVGDIGAIDQKCIRTAARAINRDIDGVRLARRVCGADVDLVGKIVRHAGCKRNQLHKVS